MFLASVPFIRYLPFLMAGILTSAIFTAEHTLLFSCLAASILVQFIFLFPAMRDVRIKFKKSRSIVLFISVYLFGWSLSSWNNHLKTAHHYSNFISSGENQKVVLKLNSPWEESHFGYKTEAVVEQIFFNESWYFTNGKIQLKTKKEIEFKLPQAGEQIIIYTKLNPIKKSKNPFDPDFATLLKRKTITHQIYLDSTNWKTGTTISNSIFLMAGEIRNSLSELLKSGIESSAHHAIVSALILGERTNIDQQIMLAFSATGTIHVLSVSGMHAGLIYLLISYLVKLVFPQERKPLFYSLFTILPLWSYALITGFSPSVLRAVAMLSLIIIGKSAKMFTNVYNTLGGSAFILLCINPDLINNAGFQLSYLAVIGIVSVHPMVYSIFYFKNKWVDKAWVLSSVSLSAQLTTFPLALFHFGTFPNYFLFTNLLIIPLSSLVLFSGIAALAFSSIPFLNELCFFVLNKSMIVLMATVHWFASIPGATTTIYLSAVECIIVYLMLLSIFILIRFKFQIAKHIFLSSAALFFIVKSFNWNTNHNTQIRFLYCKNCNAISFQTQSKNYLFTQGKLPDPFFMNGIQNEKDRRELNTLIQFHVDSLPNQAFSCPYFCYNEGILSIGNFRVGLIIGSQKKRAPLNVNAVLVSGLHPYSSIREMDQFNCQLIILGNGCSKRRREKWKEYALNNKKTMWSIPDSGAKVISLYFP